jgi:hypothetical protein
VTKDRGHDCSGAVLIHGMLQPSPCWLLAHTTPHCIPRSLPIAFNVDQCRLD